jgi:DNA-directed DNA polymerase III PolC
MIPLTNHSNYTLLKGAVNLDNLISAAREYNLPSLALSDENGMYGLISFYKKCTEQGIKPIIGSHINDPVNTSLSAVLLAKNSEGYSELCKIITSRKLNEKFSLIDVLNSISDNFIIITSSLPLLQQMISFRNVFLPLKASKKFRKENRELYNYAEEKNIGIIASDPVYFRDKDDHMLHKVLTAIRLNTTLDNVGTDVVDGESYFKHPSEINSFFRSVPAALENTYKISNQCNTDLKLKQYKFPTYHTGTGENSYTKLWNISFEGLNKRYKPVTKQVEERLIMELEVIRELGFPDYFLVVWDIVKEAKKRGMMLIGRGSAANSIVSYCLGLTQVDPIKYNLYFERFLNKGRSSPPDVDIDFSWKERDEIVKYVFEKYGYENVAMISTHVTFRARSAFRETAKVFGFSDKEISKYSKYIPWTNAHNLPNLANLFPESRSLDFSKEPWKTIVSIASKLAGFPRHLSIHPGGIIITPSPITDYVALEYASNKGLGLIITQPDMYSVEDLGLIKIDLLSQRSLGVLRDTMSRLNKRSGKN